MKQHFGDLLGGKKTTAKKAGKKIPANMDDMLSSAKVRSNTRPTPAKELDPDARRGKRYKNAEGEVVKLDGKVQEIPLNAYEVQLLEQAAKQAGLAPTAYLRSLLIRDARERLGEG